MQPYSMAFPWSAAAQMVTFNETTLPTAGSAPQGIVAGIDDAAWFTEASSDKIGRITCSGIVTEFALPPGSHPQQITLDYQDDSLWFTTVLEWNATDPNVVQVAVDSQGTIWEIPSSRTLTFTDFIFGNRTITDVVQIAPGTGTPEWILDGQQQIFTYELYSGYQESSQVSGALTEISVSADGNVWGVKSSRRFGIRVKRRRRGPGLDSR